MTSTLKEPSWNDLLGRDDEADSRGAEPGKNQRDTIEIQPPAGARTAQPSAPRHGDGGTVVVEVPPAAGTPSARLDASASSRAPASGAADPDADAVAPDAVTPEVEMTAGSSAARDILDVGVSGADDLRRLEESIRWLMSAGTAPMPGAAPLPPVLGLAPFGGHQDEALLLDPDTLFPPRAARRGHPLVAGAAKILLVSAIAAPTAYFAASWLQVRGTPSDPAAVSAVAQPADPAAVTPVKLSENQAAASSSPSVPAASSSPDADVAGRPALNARAAVSSGMKDTSAASEPQQASPPGKVVVAMVERAPEAVASEPPPAAAPAPAAAPTAAAVAPASVILPVKPAMRPEDIAMMVERGRVLFESGDVAAARLFFRRAANAGDSGAAMAMGSTYDPEVLAQRFIRGIEPNPAEAQRWYEKAKDIGQHVEMLAQRR